MYTTTTTTTTTTVASTQSLTSSIRSSSIGGGCDHFGINLPQHHLGAAAPQADDVEAIMQQLEFESKFARDELKEESPIIIADLEDDRHEDHIRKIKKAIVLHDMKDEERKRNAYEYTLTYSCGIIEEERRKETKRVIREHTSLINVLIVMASDDRLVGAQAVQQPV